MGSFEWDNMKKRLGAQESTQERARDIKSIEGRKEGGSSVNLFK